MLVDDKLSSHSKLALIAPDSNALNSLDLEIYLAENLLNFPSETTATIEPEQWVAADWAADISIHWYPHSQTSSLESVQ